MTADDKAPPRGALEEAVNEAVTADCQTCCGTGHTSGLYANVDRMPADAFKCHDCDGTGIAPPPEPPEPRGGKET